MNQYFEYRRRTTYVSINYIASHDHFTMRDMVSYSERHNEVNGEDGRDGHGENLLHSWGFQDKTNYVEINRFHEHVKRVMLTTMFFTHRTPIRLGGVEIFRRQKGNNKAYSKDNKISWFNWNVATRIETTQTPGSPDYIATRISLWKNLLGLCSGNFLHGNREISLGIRDTVWFDETGNELTLYAWSDAAAQLLTLLRTANPAKIR